MAEARIAYNNERDQTIKELTDATRSGNVVWAYDEGIGSGYRCWEATVGGVAIQVVPNWREPSECDHICFNSGPWVDVKPTLQLGLLAAIRRQYQRATVDPIAQLVREALRQRSDTQDDMSDVVSDAAPCTVCGKHGCINPHLSQEQWVDHEATKSAMDILSLFIREGFADVGTGGEDAFSWGTSGHGDELRYEFTWNHEIDPVEGRGDTLPAAIIDATIELSSLYAGIVAAGAEGLDRDQMIDRLNEWEQSTKTQEAS